jgi:hypothetical protein
MGRACSSMGKKRNSYYDFDVKIRRKETAKKI